ncbi:MAG: hypothetical protein JXP34_13255 [Planctomycetes bacterium]|nr:hypothetical protein [Planctomycetota bacterium]
MYRRLAVRNVTWLLAAGCAAAIGCAGSPSTSDRVAVPFASNAALVDASISDIISHPSGYVGRTVLVAGGFGGLPAPESDPVPGTVAWVLREGRSGIAVTGPFPAGCLPPKTGLGSRVILLADVRMTPAGLVYLAPAASRPGGPAR